MKTFPKFRKTSLTEWSWELREFAFELTDMHVVALLFEFFPPFEINFIYIASAII